MAFILVRPETEHPEILEFLRQQGEEYHSFSDVNWQGADGPQVVHHDILEYINAPQEIIRCFDGLLDLEDRQLLHQDKLQRLNQLLLRASHP